MIGMPLLLLTSLRVALMVIIDHNASLGVMEVRQLILVSHLPGSPSKRAPVRCTWAVRSKRRRNQIALVIILREPTPNFRLISLPDS